jgi:hypothetical protein
LAELEDFPVWVEVHVGVDVGVEGLQRESVDVSSGVGAIVLI